MKPAAFIYHAPASVDEAVALLAEWGPQDGRVLAGGQSLVPSMAFRLARPTHLIDINEIAELQTLAVKDGLISIGAGVRHAAFEAATLPGATGALLRKVVGNIAHYPIRTRGTFCGSVANADPASEWCCVMAALDGIALLRSQRGIRRVRQRKAHVRGRDPTLRVQHGLEDRGVRLREQGAHDGKKDLGVRPAVFDLARETALDHRDELVGAEVRRRANGARRAHAHQRQRERTQYRRRLSTAPRLASHGAGTGVGVGSHVRSSFVPERTGAGCGHRRR